MLKNKRTGAVLIALLVLVSLFSGCKKAAPSYDTPLVIAYDDFSEKFSPFFGTTSYDNDVTAMTQISLLTTDRLGGIIYNAIDGEVVEYNGTPYTYKGVANLKIDYDPNANYYDDNGRRVGLTTYTFELRKDLKFSDGVAVTADDVIFSFYTFCDPTYTGSTTLNALDILGVNEYRTQANAEMTAKYSAIYYEIQEAGYDHSPSAGDGWTQAMADYVWRGINRAWWTSQCAALSDYIAAGYADNYAERFGFNVNQVKTNDGYKTAFGMCLWGFGDYDDGVLEGAVTGKTWDLSAGQYPTAADYAEECILAYDGNAYEFYDVEMDGVPLPANLELHPNSALFVSRFASEDPAAGNESYSNIEGIRKIDNYTVEIRVKGFDAAAVYRIGIQVSPLHYYGDRAKFDYNNNKFGFDFGDLSKQESLTTRPLGAGAYKFIEYRDQVVYFEANPNYWRGEPYIKNIQFKVTPQGEKVSGILAGTIDISDPSFDANTRNEISRANTNGQLSGNRLDVSMVDFLGYGYIGINADTVNVGGNPSSNASKNLRRGFATILAVLREEYCDTYYGAQASVINYPISNTSWAAPQQTDSGYRIAFSTGTDGRDLYTSSMGTNQRYEAAIVAATDYFKAAGYTFGSDGKMTAAPDGAKMSYEIIIPAQGTGDHPTFQLLIAAKDMLDRIGMELVVNDPSNSNVLWDRLDTGLQEMWCAAWGATIDPDMYQVYHSSNVIGTEGASESNHYHIRDADLDQLIFDARNTADIPVRKARYKAALDIIIDWAVEIPYYQRSEVIVYSNERINMATVTPDITPFWGYLSEIETLELLGK